MKSLIAISLLASAFAFAETAPSTNPGQTEKPEPPGQGEVAVMDGSTFAKAVVVGSVGAEYEWLRKNFPGHKVRSQRLMMHAGKPYDVLAITTRDGSERDVYFDISSFFGKELK